MKPIVIAAALLMCGSAFAQGVVYRDGYVRKDGVYVPPSYATKPNNTKLDNFSTQGNINAYTGQAGTVNPNAFPQSPPLISHPKRDSAYPYQSKPINGF